MKLKIKSDGLCALLRHQFESHPEKEGVERCRFCGKTRKVKDEVGGSERLGATKGDDVNRVSSTGRNR